MNNENNLKQKNENKITNTENLNYFKFILGIFLKPYDKYKEEENKISDYKNIVIIAGILIGAMTILQLLFSCINAVRVTSFWNNETTWVWENLKNVAFFKTILISILLNAGIIAAIAGVYYLASLVIKKEVKFNKLLAGSLVAYIPFGIISSLITPLLSLIYVPFSIISSIVGFIYMLAILLVIYNELIVIEDKNKRIYFHLICLSILIVGIGFIGYKIILGSIANGLEGITL